MTWLSCFNKNADEKKAEVFELKEGDSLEMLLGKGDVLKLDGKGILIKVFISRSLTGKMQGGKSFLNSPFLFTGYCVILSFATPDMGKYRRDAHE